MMSSIRKFPTAKPKAIRLSEESLVSIGVAPEEQFPLLVQPCVDNLNLADWAQAHRPLIRERLEKHGALLFRNFNLDSTTRFEQVVRAVAPELIEYGERSSPRTKIAGGVYTSTDHPADQHILLHNEQSYTLNWPMKICFFCVQPAEQRGSTPIADSRNILRRLQPSTVERFEQRGITYVRNYGDGLGLPWQEVFQTHSKAQVEEQCRQTSIEVEWKDGDRLRTRQVRPAVRKHPATGERVWFNHALFFHLSGLEREARESLLAVVSEEDVPFNTFYGDGTPIEPEVLEELREAYAQETVSFTWRQHDLLMLDNVLVAHGRESYVGERKIAVVMAEPYASYARNGG